MRKLLTFFIFLFLISCFNSISLSYAPFENYSEIARIEQILFNNTYPGLEVSDRVRAIEKNLFGRTYINDSLELRTERIKESVIEQKEKYIFNNKDPVIKSSSSYENTQSKALNDIQFLELLYRRINDQRSFKGQVPLISDQVAEKVAFDHASNLILKGNLSYFNLKGEGPDERYTLAGGTGATTEIIKGFELEKNNKQIILNELLITLFIQALLQSTDDSNVLYNRYLSHIGCGFALSKDKSKFVVVLEFITKGGEFEPLKVLVNLGDKINISGKVNLPYSFKAVSVGYFDPLNLSDFESNDTSQYFDNETLKPYFPPQDFIAYGDIGKSNFLKVLKGIGVIGAFVGAPFTGGATAILAPVIISSIQSGTPREIPLKRGIKANSNGEFTGTIDLNYQGKSGIYFVSVLAELPSLNFPVVISRRTIRVNAPLHGAYGS